MHRLALALGRTVAELKASLGSGELARWKAYSVIEPFGQWRDNWHTAVLATTIANYAARKNVTKVTDFMYVSPTVKRDRETRAVLAKLDAIAKHGN